MKAIKILERVLVMIPIMLGVAVLVFFFMRLTRVHIKLGVKQ